MMGFVVGVSFVFGLVGIYFGLAALLTCNQLKNELKEVNKNISLQTNNISQIVTWGNTVENRLKTIGERQLQ